MANKIKIGIIGGAGYTAGELIRILVNHPAVEITFVHSKSNAGNPIHAVHTDLIGELTIKFTNEINNNIDVLFLCMGHGASRKFMEENTFDNNLKIIDLSQDFRLHAEGNDFIYGLPELNREIISKSRKIANPGCFATCIELGLLPLAAADKIHSDVHISGITGSTGAGQSLSPTSHFSWRNNNMSVYKAFTHQHLKEIRQSLTELQHGLQVSLNFIPYRGNFTRGIMVSSYLKTNLNLEEAFELYHEFYKAHPFTFLTKENPDLKQVVNTNNALVYVEKNDDNLLVISCIDNLLKGASGQAVHNMNLVFGLEETSGLKLKAGSF
ncbi:MAG: N-acetyl-gamma-glutamyl-phosphate reductase [Bacteroidota bacterium]|nr:N-acetyl-gamma-glutamyl-phosphate reductase [Bacteroidota bacterium]